jgi:hypothetical protein
MWLSNSGSYPSSLTAASMPWRILDSSIQGDLVRTLRASLLASVAGTVAWALGLMREIWPAHPQWALFFLTIGAATALYYILPDSEKKANSE